MGYETTFYGGIGISDKKTANILRYLIDNNLEPFDDVYDVSIDDMTINFSCSGKYYEKQIQKVCYFILLLDEKANGFIECKGEEDSDIWAIEIKDGEVNELAGEIKYKQDQRFTNNHMEQKAEEIKNDGDLEKKIMLSKLK